MMKTLSELQTQFNGRFVFEITQQRGMVRCIMVDTHKQRRRSLVAPTMSMVLDEAEHECVTIVNNDSN